jgi:hypothetical protein
VPNRPRRVAIHEAGAVLAGPATTGPKIDTLELCQLTTSEQSDFVDTDDRPDAPRTGGRHTHSFEASGDAWSGTLRDGPSDEAMRKRSSATTRRRPRRV